jgi:hypothetical protein
MVDRTVSVFDLFTPYYTTTIDVDHEVLGEGDATGSITMHHLPGELPPYAPGDRLQITITHVASPSRDES